MHIALIYNRWLIFCLCTCTHWEHKALSQSLAVCQLLLHQMNHSYSLSEMAWLKYSTSIPYMREDDLLSYFSSSSWELICEIKGLSKFPADGAQMQTWSHELQFLWCCIPGYVYIWVWSHDPICMKLHPIMSLRSCKKLHDRDCIHDVISSAWKILQTKS
jgi:hypothetical protein